MSAVFQHLREKIRKIVRMAFSNIEECVEQVIYKRHHPFRLLHGKWNLSNKMKNFHSQFKLFPNWRIPPLRLIIL